MNPDEARDALAGMQQAKDQLARAVDCPPWRHAAFGAVMALIVAATTVPDALFAPLFCIAMAGLVLIAQDDRRRYGVFVNGWRRGRTLPVAIGLALVELGLVALGLPARHLPFPSALGLGCIAAAFVAAVIASLLFQRIYRAELEGPGA